MASDSKHGGIARQPVSRKRKRGGLFALDSESSSRLLLIGVVGLVLAVALGFIAYGYYDSVIKPRNRTVLSVEGTSVSFSEMKRRMRYEYSLSSATYQQAPQLLPDLTYQTVVEELTLVGQAEPALGLVIDENEFDQRLRLRIGAPQDADQRAYADAMRRELARTGLQEDELRRLVRAELLRSKAREKFTGEVPASVEQAQIEVISVVGQDAAQQVIGRIQAGEDWATVWEEVSTDQGLQEPGGFIDFRPKVLHNAVYRDFAFNAAPGEISPPLAATTAPDGTTYYVVRTKDRAERPLAEDQRSSYVSTLYSEWMTQTQSALTIEDKFDEATRVEALVYVTSNPLPSAVQPSAPQPQLPPVEQPPVQAPPSDSAAPPVPEAPVAPAPGDGQ